MAQDSWAEAYEPLEMLGQLREPPSRYSDRRRERHAELLNTYTLRCLKGIDADDEADLFRDYAFGFPGDSDELIFRREALQARAGVRSGGGSSVGHRPRHIPLYAQRAQAALAAINALGGYGGTPWRAADAVTRETQHLIQREQCAWLRCLFPNPLGASVVEGVWLTSTVVNLVRGIATDNAFDRLPILADALQDADCDNEDLLHHCRHDTIHGPHCWAVAAILESLKTGTDAS